MFLRFFIHKHQKTGGNEAEAGSKTLQKRRFSHPKNQKAGQSWVNFIKKMSQFSSSRGIFTPPRSDPIGPTFDPPFFGGVASGQECDFCTFSKSSFFLVKSLQTIWQIRDLLVGTHLLLSKWVDFRGPKNTPFFRSLQGFD